MSPFASRRGFTLIELLAAMSIAGFAMLGGMLLIDQLADATVRIARERELKSRTHNGARLMRQLLRDVRVSADTADRMLGDDKSVNFTTLCQQSGGWMERCRALLLLDRRGDTTAVIAQFATGERVTLREVPQLAQFRYNDNLSVDSSWVNRWALRLSLPLAIGIISGGDTAVYPVGAER